MWCDDFDMDLPKVIPAARQALGTIGDLGLVTHGNITDGKLNHPSVWNHHLGMVSFFGRPGRMGKPEGYWTNDPIVHCTLWEALRDAWSHSNAILFEGRTVIWKSLDEHFMPLMYDLRGWNKMPDSEREERKMIVLDAIVDCGGLVEQMTNGRALAQGGGVSDFYKWYTEHYGPRMGRNKIRLASAQEAWNASRQRDEKVEIRLNPDGSLDEIVAQGFHLEKMSATHWWMEINGVHVNFHSKGTIKANVERGEG